MLAVARARMAAHFAFTGKGDRNARKYFVIGYPRCGTTTMHQLFEANGIRSLHTPADWPTGKYDAFSDFGQIRPIEAFESVYPNAVYIVNTRPIDRYLQSLADQIYPGWTFTPQHFVNEIYRRARYFSWVLEHFSGRDDCFVVNIEAPGSVDWIAGQLGLEPTEGGRDHANKGKRPLLETTRMAVDEAMAQCGLSGLEQTAFFTLAELQGRSEIGTELAVSDIPAHLL